MSSDLSFFEPDLQFMPADPLLPFCDPDIPFHDPDICFSPSHQLESLSLCQEVPMGSFQNGFGFVDQTSYAFGCNIKDGTGLKGEGSPAGYEPFTGPHSYGGHEGGINHVVKHMQRSYSSNSFEEKPELAAALFHPQFDTVMESNADQFRGPGGMMSSPESSILGAHMRRVCSTGDLQRTSLASNLGTESAYADEANLKVGRYSAEERKERILKYRAKRTQRNFTKTIKYACRKTLADNRPRIRGRFARNDEVGDLPKAPCSSRDDDDENHDQFWMMGMQLEEEDVGRGKFFGNGCGPNYGQPQCHYSYGYHYYKES